MGTYLFHDVNIHLFDINLLPGLLLSPKATVKNPDFRFLTIKKQYDENQTSGEITKSDSFVCYRFPPSRLDNSHLFARYRYSYSTSPASFWDQQIPFYLRLRKHDLCLNLIPPEKQPFANIDSYVWLNSLGWSTHIDIHLSYKMTVDDLAEMTACLRDKPSSSMAYNLNGKSLSLKEFFKAYKDLLIKDIFHPKVEPTRPDNFWNLIFISILEASGTVTPLTTMENIDLFSFLKILLLYPERKRIEYEYQGYYRVPKVENMLVTDIANDYRNFSLTEFNVGSFILLQVEAIERNQPVRAMCYGRNVSDFFWLAYTWMYYYRLIEQKVEENARIRRLLQKGAQSLANIDSMNFHNRTTQGVANNHSGIIKFIYDNLEY